MGKHMQNKCLGELDLAPDPKPQRGVWRRLGELGRSLPLYLPSVSAILTDL